MAENGAVNCLSCLPGFYNPDKRSINKCKRCMKEEEVANELGMGFIDIGGKIVSFHTLF